MVGGFSLLAWSCVVPATAQSSTPIKVYLSKPKVESSPFSGTYVETFSEMTPGVYTNSFAAIDSATGKAFGTYYPASGGKYAILADSGNNQQYSAGTSNYISIGAQSSSSQPLTLHLNTPASYFGFSWNAGDAQNGITFYNGTTEVGRFATSDILTLLNKGSGTVTAVDGNKYNTSSYFGQPTNTNLDSSEPFAFVNFFDVVGTFDNIVFDNSNTTGTGFESDNHTVFDPTTDSDPSFVYVGGTKISLGDPKPATAPEPGATGLMVALGLTCSGIFLRRRKRN